MQVTTNLITEDDIDGVLEVSSLSFSLCWSKNSYIQELSNPLANYIVAKDQNKVIGFAGAWLILDEAHITNIAVHPNYRNQKIASKLLEELIAHTKRKGSKSFTLEVRASNNAAQCLYNKYGFTQNGIRKRYYEDNKEDAIIMWRIDE
ncbi:ribosomal protein S18-alanine N-acetyltransferase [Clostridium uliginosum]|uniref:[Ribosomal protein bS18]-alanine N-acetyltransferase n=1 Tax=Clostridium uliginosum TaxID=119641 RepID=A0A1I1I7T8_9CLOT|nr:ribosomal protein S18-alanine N-acetyltransferase [Clostridium uliginosum]SFC32224.1 ribosomal-protein-alanine N-acetyltransferase [Clostridium uliginosum]